MLERMARGGPCESLVLWWKEEKFWCSGAELEVSHYFVISYYMLTLHQENFSRFEPRLARV